MTPDEVMSIFHKPHDKVPEYEVVPVLHRTVKEDDSKEATNELKLKVFNDDVRLYLNPTEGILASENTPVWTASSDSEAPEGLQYKEVPRAMDYMGIPLQDVSSSSSVLLTPTPNGQIHLDGVLNNIYAIKSLPRRILKDVLYGGHNLYEPHHTKNVTDDEDFAYTHHHVVYKVPTSEPYKDFKITDPENSSRVKRDSPDTIYPEFIIVADYSLYKLLGENMEQTVKYLVSFWNGVDLRYRLLTTPKIRFNIAGIIIGTDWDATPYMQNSRVEVSSVDADRALRSMADYFYREERFPKDFYDMAITMTHLDMCNMITDDFCDPSTLGYAYVAGACDRNATKQSSEAVGIVEDNGGYSGIIPTAHEIGHLIGARHDGNPKGAGDCAAHDGFIMTSGLMLHENGFEWSSCSINAFYDFITEERAKCLYNEPVTMGAPITRVLPGTLMSLDDQCMKALGTPACNKQDASVCIRLECEYPGIEGFCRASAPAAEGSSCGDGLICLNGKCVLEGIIPKDTEKKKLLEKFLPKFVSQKIRKIPWLQLLKKLKDKLKDRLKKRLFA
ncbi:hypothetical protein PUN28_005686 [Cardiocondyla obscurior]